MLQCTVIDGRMYGNGEQLSRGSRSRISCVEIVASTLGGISSSSASFPQKIGIKIMS